MSEIEKVMRTTMIDCNQRSSTQFLGGNRDSPAIFTNEIGQGIDLEVGDEVQVHGVMISNVGAGSDTIEFKGETLVDYKNKPKTHEFTYIKTQKIHPILPYTDRNIMGGYQQIFYSEVTEQRAVHDNKADIILNFYNTSNGEYYSQGATEGRCIAEFTKPYGFANADYSYYKDGYNNDGDTNRYPQGHYILKNDNSRYVCFKQMGANYYCKTPIDPTQEVTPTDATIVGKYPAQTSGAYSSPYLMDPGIYNYTSDKAYARYRELVNLELPAGFNSPSNIAFALTTQLKEGTNFKPFEILDDGDDKSDPDKDYTRQTQRIGTTYESPTFKPMRCGSYETFGKDAYDHFHDYDETDPTTDVDSVYKYQSNFENIYVKRPDLFETGRKLNTYQGLSLMNDISQGDTSSHYIQTDVVYNEANLKKFSEYFKAQANYPELFEGENWYKYISVPAGSSTTSGATIENSRFLHINQFNNNLQESMLGSDGYLYHQSTSKRDIDPQSVPFLIAYDKKYIDIETGGHDINKLSYGFATKNKIIQADLDAVATKHTANGLSSDHFDADTFYIRLHPELIGGLNQNVFTQYYKDLDDNFLYHSITDLFKGERLFGHDYHFNAYGTSCMIGFSGLLNKGFQAVDNIGVTNKGQRPVTQGIQTQPPTTRDANFYPQQKFTETSKYITQSYIGAQDPLFNFDSVQTRFFFSRLHTPETEGQTSELVGSNAPSNPPINPTALQEVWKMNKIFLMNSLCPDLRPYLRQTEIVIRNSSVIGVNQVPDFAPLHWGYTNGAMDQYYAMTSEQSDHYAIFDTQTGCIIEDFGYDKEDFVNGMWGILGFSYEQFNTNDNSVNVNTRISGVNKEALPFCTNQAPSNDGVFRLRFMDDQSGTKSQGEFARSVNVTCLHPSVQEVAESIKIEAVNLPRKVLQPYYTIRSDILDTTHYIGSKTSRSSLPVMAVLNKQYSSGDFVFLGNQGQVFKITHPRTMTSVTSMICDPDGTISNIDDGSAIIYTIARYRNMKVNLMGDFLKSQEENKKSNM